MRDARFDDPAASEAIRKALDAPVEERPKRLPTPSSESTRPWSIRPVPTHGKARKGETR